MEASTGGPTAVHNAVYYCDFNAVIHLVGTGISVNSFDQEGFTTLHCAVLTDSLEMLVLLSELGARIDAGTRELNQTPAHYTAMFGRVECLNMLSRYGASLTVQDNSVNGESQSIQLSDSIKLKQYFGC
jgi:ankyrin repeat protein